MNLRAVFYALASALLFGISTPAAKVLLSSMHPAVLAGLLYCGAGAGVMLLRTIHWGASTGTAEARLQRTDLPWLAGAITAGGVIGPVLLLFGLSRTSASTSALLLTFEGLTTALMAWFVFHESLDRRIALGMLLPVAGAIVLAWSGSPTFDGLIGPLAIVGACIAWGLDNNFTRKISLADPLQIVAAKGLVAGPVTLLLGLWPTSYPPWPPPSSAFCATA
jgi:drug/metabolite transporter (DMT)-like permease